jgi:hypothetical protein
MKKILAAAGFSALALSATAALAQSDGYRIIGFVTSDGEIEGTKVIACSVPYQECETKVEASVNRVDRTSGSFSMKVPTKGPYQIVAWNDVDGNEDSSVGDYVGIANEGNGVNAPKLALSIDMSEVTEDNAVGSASASNDTDSPGGGSAGAGFAGSWTQSSNASELVLSPTIKQQPAMATGYGTNLGGTFGRGSPMNTVIVNELKPMNVKRNMNLQVSGDGSFRWKITKVQSEATCSKTFNQEKVGRITTSGNKLTFNITGGSDSFSGCGKSGSSNIRATSETYTYTKSGSTLTLKGGGGVNWTFRKG